MRFDLETKASPEQVRRAMTDFTERRLPIWKGTLDPKRYELRDLGEHWAVAKECSPGSPVWIVARYDWSDPDVVRWTVTESSYRGAGGGFVRAAPRDDGGGFVRAAPRDDGGGRVHAEWVATDASGVQRPLVFLVNHSFPAALIARMWTSVLDRYALDGGR